MWQQAGWRPRLYINLICAVTDLDALIVFVVLVVLAVTVASLDA